MCRDEKGLRMKFEELREYVEESFKIAVAVFGRALWFKRTALKQFQLFDKRIVFLFECIEREVA